VVYVFLPTPVVMCKVHFSNIRFCHSWLDCALYGLSPVSGLLWLCQQSLQFLYHQLHLQIPNSAAQLELYSHQRPPPFCSLSLLCFIVIYISELNCCVLEVYSQVSTFWLILRHIRAMKGT
jgi:hypothetical protein